MSGIQHRNACGEIDVLVAPTSFSVAFSADWAKKLHITPPRAEWQKDDADGIHCCSCFTLLTLHG